MGSGTGCLLGQDVKQDLAMHMHGIYIHISLIFITFRLYGKNVCRDVVRPIPAKRVPGSLNLDPSKSGTIFIM